MNTMFQTKAGIRWMWKVHNGVTKTENDYILTNRPDIVTDVTVINQVNIDSDHRIAISNVKLEVEVERKRFRTTTQRMQQDQHQERSTTEIHHIAHAVYGSTRKHIPKSDLEFQRPEDRQGISQSYSRYRRHTHMR